MLQVGMCKATSNPRAYLQAKCDDGKWKLVIGVSEKQSKEYLSIVTKMKLESQEKVSKGLKLWGLKAWATTRRAELLK